MKIGNKQIAFTKANIIDAYAKFALEWQRLIGVNTLVHELPTQQKNLPHQTLTSFSHFHDLQIARLMWGRYL